MSFLRLFVAAFVLVGGIFATHTMQSSNAPQEHRPLRDFPAAIASWHSEDLPFDAEDVKEIGVDDYTNREYFGASRPIELYIGYYKDQRSGDAIHSPKNCLPGAGWEPVRSTRLQIGSAEKPVTGERIHRRKRNEPGLGSLLVPDARTNRGERVLGKVLARRGRGETQKYRRGNDTHLDHSRGRRRKRANACDGLRSACLSASLRIPAELTAMGRFCSAAHDFSGARIVH